MSISNQLKQEIPGSSIADLPSCGLVGRGLTKMSTKAKQILLWIAKLLPKPHTQFEITYGSSSNKKQDQDK